MTTTIDQNLRDRYFSNEIFQLGDIVEDTKTGEPVKIIDRGVNYVTVATSNGFGKRWLNEIVYKSEVEVVLEQVQEETLPSPTSKDSNFTITESGQIKIFGYETRNFDSDTSDFLVEQFSEFDDLYSKHQIIKCLDLAMGEDDLDRAYSLLEKVDKFYSTQNIKSPLIVEVIKNETERRRIAEILAAVASIAPSKETSKTVSDSIKALKEKYSSRIQWEVLVPLLKLAKASGLPGATQNLPYSLASFDTSKTEEFSEEEMIEEIISENIDLTVDDLDYEDICESFCSEEFSDQLLFETLSIEARAKLSRKLKQRASQIEAKRDRALTHSASSEVLMQRARKLAETMLKRRIFHKGADDLTRQEKERFESGAINRRALVNRLAQKLLPKVRMLQSARLHHTNTPSSHTHDKATAALGKAAHGAS